ncbi:hypothetical protein [Streptomyces sp. NPDC053431]|uniref:hypothetical protein n=1 Tax=Streptomyces sp. NPDC053431 TaxID=3365703 RepID=UPI0037D91731
MSITSPIPVLEGDRGAELSADGEELLLRRPDEVLRIPFAAIARVSVERRDVAVELTAPAGTEPTVYRVKGVSAAAATVFADAVNAALPDRDESEEPADGATLVVTRSLVSGDERDEGDEEGEDERERGLGVSGRWVTCTALVAVAALAVVVGLLDKNWGRGIATLLLGELGVGSTLLTWTGLRTSFDGWYLPRYGITVDAQQVYRHGTTTNAYTATDGVTRYVGGDNEGKPVRVAYHPRKPQIAIVRKGWGELAGTLSLLLVIAAISGFIDYGTLALALPAFDG